jgi:hypothetical protein
VHAPASWAVSLLLFFCSFNAINNKNLFYITLHDLVVRLFMFLVDHKVISLMAAV